MISYFTDPAWLAVLLATLALIPQLVKGGRWLWQRWQMRHFPKDTQPQKDRVAYGLLLQKYEGYLTMLENLIVLRSQVERGPDPFTPEMRERLVSLRDDIYASLEKRGKVENEMGDLQKLDILEGRMVGIADLRRRREELEERQAEIENHPLFIRRDS